MKNVGKIKKNVKNVKNVPGIKKRKKTFFLHLCPTCYHAEFCRSRSCGCCVITEIIRKSLTFRAPLFKVTQGHWNRYGSIGYL